MNNTSISDHNIPIHDDNPPNVGGEGVDHDHTQTDLEHKCSEWADKCHNLSTKCIVINTGRQKEEAKEGEAYEKLMKDLWEAKWEKGYVVAWIIHVVILIVFIIVIITFTSINPPWRLLNKRIQSWLALLMVLVSGLRAIRIATYVVSEPFIWVIGKLNRYLLFFARQMRKCVVVTLWFMLVLWVWYTFFQPEIVKDTSGAHVLHTETKEYQRVLKIVVKQITRLLMALTLGALLWTVKSVVFLKFQADLLYKELCARVRQTILDIHAIQFIETGRKWVFKPPRKTLESNLKDSTGNAHPSTEMSFWMCVSLLKRERAPIWILKRLTESYLEYMKNKPKILLELEEADDDEKLMDAAKKMFNKVIDNRENDSDITHKDLRKYDLNDNEIVCVFKLFGSKGKEIRIETAQTKEEIANSTKKEEEEIEKARITQDQFLRWSVLALKNCLGLERTLKSSELIFRKLNYLMSSCVVVVTIVIWVLLTEIVTTGQIAILFAPFISASFIFADSMKAVFGGLVFVFGTHPFDVDDRVKIDDVEMKVNKMNILRTDFIEYNSGVQVIYPNSDLANKKVVNLDITPDQSDSIEFTVPIDTQQELISDLQFRIKKTLDDDLTFASSTTVAKKDIVDKGEKEALKLVVHFKYLVSYLSAETKAQHRSRILSKIMRLRYEMEQGEAPLDEHVGILSFKIDAKQKLPDIEELKKKIKEVCQTLKYKRSLDDHSRVVIAGIDKEKITMNVRMRYPKDQDKDNLKLQVENAIKVKYPKFKDIAIEHHPIDWLPKQDWDDV